MKFQYSFKNDIIYVDNLQYQEDFEGLKNWYTLHQNENNKNDNEESKQAYLQK